MFNLLTKDSFAIHPRCTISQTAALALRWYVHPRCRTVALVGSVTTDTRQHVTYTEARDEPLGARVRVGCCFSAVHLFVVGRGIIIILVSCSGCTLMSSCKLPDVCLGEQSMAGCFTIRRHHVMGWRAVVLQTTCVFVLF